MQDGVEVYCLPDGAKCESNEEKRSPLDIDVCPMGYKKCDGDCLCYKEDNDLNKKLDMNKISPVGGVDRGIRMDRISLQNAVETPFWLAVWATEPERRISVEMSYSDLKIITDLIDAAIKKLDETAQSQRASNSQGGTAMDKWEGVS